MQLVYDTSGCSSQGLSWSPSYRYLNRSKLASTRLCNNHIIYYADLPTPAYRALKSTKYMVNRSIYPVAILITNCKRQEPYCNNPKLDIPVLLETAIWHVFLSNRLFLLQPDLYQLLS